MILSVLGALAASFEECAVASTASLKQWGGLGRGGANFFFFWCDLAISLFSSYYLIQLSLLG